MIFDIPEHNRIPEIDEFPNFLVNHTAELSDKVTEVLSNNFVKEPDSVTIWDELFHNYNPSHLALYHIALNSNNLEIKTECISSLLDHCVYNDSEILYLYKIAHDVRNSSGKHIDSEFEELPLNWMILMKCIELIKSTKMHRLNTIDLRDVLKDIWGWMPPLDESDVKHVYEELHDFTWVGDSTKLVPNVIFKEFYTDFFNEVEIAYNSSVET
jgi:hypothetical protein